MRSERQVKIRGTISPAQVLDLAGERLSATSQKDIFLAPDPMSKKPIRCIRQENGTYCLSEKRPYADSTVIGQQQAIRSRHVTEELITERQRDELCRRDRTVLVVSKQRVTFLLRGAIVTIDRVEDLGDFVEVRAETDEKIREVVELLGLSMSQAVGLSYFDMALELHEPEWRRLLIQFHDQSIGPLVFGLVSGTMLSMASIIGVGIATGSYRAVVACILCGSGSDSIADACGMFFQRRADRCPWRVAIRSAFGTFLGKAFLPLLFILCLLAPSLTASMAAALIGGSVLLALLGAETALVQKESPGKSALAYLALGLAVAGFCSFVGYMVNTHVAE